MKKLISFTLAEILITLAIIGVVAALAVPNLVKKYQKHVTLTGFKEIYSILTNAYAQAVAEHGEIDTWAGMNDNPLPAGETNRDKVTAEYFEPYLSIDKISGSKPIGSVSSKIYAKNKKTLTDGNNNYFGYNYQLKNGMFVRFNNLGPDYVFKYFVNIGIDINGLKGPNAFGYDKFIFVIPNRPGMAQHKKISGFGYPNSREQYKNAYYGCNNTGSYGGYACSTLILTDGFRISDDYEW